MQQRDGEMLAARDEEPQALAGSRRPRQRDHRREGGRERFQDPPTGARRSLVPQGEHRVEEGGPPGGYEARDDRHAHE